MSSVASTRSAVAYRVPQLARRAVPNLRPCVGTLWRLARPIAGPVRHGVLALKPIPRTILNREGLRRKSQLALAAALGRPVTVGLRQSQN